VEEEKEEVAVGGWRAHQRRRYRRRKVVRGVEEVLEVLEVVRGVEEDVLLEVLEVRGVRVPELAVWGRAQRRWCPCPHLLHPLPYEVEAAALRFATPARIAS
jgi:hypothetical protein